MQHEKISPAAKAIVREYIRNDAVTLAGLKAISEKPAALVEAIAFIEGCSAQTRAAQEREDYDRREQSREEERDYFASGNADSDRDSKRFGGAW